MCAYVVDLNWLLSVRMHAISSISSINTQQQSIDNMEPPVSHRAWTALDSSLPLPSWPEDVSAGRDPWTLDQTSARRNSWVRGLNCPGSDHRITGSGRRRGRRRGRALDSRPIRPRSGLGSRSEGRVWRRCLPAWQYWPTWREKSILTKNIFLLLYQQFLQSLYS